VEVGRPAWFLTGPWREWRWQVLVGNEGASQADEITLNGRRGLLLTVSAAADDALHRLFRLLCVPVDVDVVDGRSVAIPAPPPPNEDGIEGDQALLARMRRLFGAVADDVLAARLPAERVLAAARVRAGANPAPTRLRRPGGGVIETGFAQPYAAFFAVDEYDLGLPRFGGGPPLQVRRAAFASGDAVTVLPYDPVRDRVLLIEQFRAGPYGRGDPDPWELEAIAGRIDVGEGPEEAARREAEEEAGVRLGPLHKVADYYPSPGVMTEFLYSFVAEADLPDGVAGLHGLADEAEDIRTHLVARADLAGLVTTGEIRNAPLLLSVAWLQANWQRIAG
jgi:ADP-ribose pyrophosphatase